MFYVSAQYKVVEFETTYIILFQEHPPLKIADAPGFWVVTSKTISVHAPITRLVGEIMDEDTGFEHYQRAAFEYSSLIIFNLGAEFQYSW